MRIWKVFFCILAGLVSSASCLEPRGLVVVYDGRTILKNAPAYEYFTIKYASGTYGMTLTNGTKLSGDARQIATFLDYTVPPSTESLAAMRQVAASYSKAAPYLTVRIAKMKMELEQLAHEPKVIAPPAPKPVAPIKEPAPPQVPKVSRERVLLLTELSDSFKIGARAVERQPNIKNLEPLLNSRDPNISKMAKVAHSMFFLFDIAVRQANIAPEIRRMQGEIFGLARSEILTAHPDAADSLQNAVNAFASSDSAFPRALAKLRESLTTGTHIHRLQNAYRDEMKRYLAATTPADPIEPRRIGVRLGSPGGNITPASPGQVVLTNFGPQDLTGVSMVLDVHPDLRRLGKLAAEKEAHIRLSGAVQGGLGVDEGAINDQLLIHRRRTEIQEMDKGTFVHIGDWPAGAEVSIYADPLGDIENFADRIDVHVFSDQGRPPVQTLNGDQMRKLIEKVVSAQGDP